MTVYASEVTVPARLHPMRHHPVQQAYWSSVHRFNTVPAGRRSGKTEIAKRRLVKRAMSTFTKWAPRFFAAGPTRDQAKRIFWEDLKAMISPLLLRRPPSESDLMLELITGAQIWVLGLDKPERVEGSPWDGGVIDEIANTKEDAWPKHVRPALSDRNGWCDLIGVPEGRNHYYRLDQRAKALQKELGINSDWGSFHWKSSEILSAKEIEAARADLDELTFDQEYNASFINFEGRAYYPFTEEEHCAPLAQLYNPKAPLILCFDFNVEPGVCAIIQELPLPGKFEMVKSPGGVLTKQQVVGTAVIGEIHIPRNSNTPAICRALLKDKRGEPTIWSKHEGLVQCYGDSTGGAKGSAKVAGSDWELIEKELRPHFKERLAFFVKDANPKERERINAVNSRLKSADGTVRMMVDGHKAPNVQTDFEGVSLLEGGSGEIDKLKDRKLTHLSDAIGYYVEFRFPVTGNRVYQVQIVGR